MINKTCERCGALLAQNAKSDLCLRCQAEKTYCINHYQRYAKDENRSFSIGVPWCELKDRRIAKEGWETICDNCKDKEPGFRTLPYLKEEEDGE